MDKHGRKFWLFLAERNAQAAGNSRDDIIPCRKLPGTLCPSNKWISSLRMFDAAAIESHLVSILLNVNQ